MNGKFFLLVCLGLIVHKAHSALCSELIQRIMQQYTVSGCAVSIVRSGDIVYEEVCGKKSIYDSQQNSIDVHTLFPIASLTKHFTAIGIGILVDQGLLNWSDPIVKHYKQLRLSNQYAQEHVTIEACLSMASGLERSAVIENECDVLSISEIEAIASQLSLVHDIGTTFSYQNVLYMWLALVIQEVTSKTLFEFFKEYLFDPLDMHHTIITHDELLHTSNKVQGHRVDESGVRVVIYENLDTIAAAAGISLSIRDMSHWLQMLTQRGEYKEKVIIRESTFKKILTPFVKLAPQDFFGDEYLRLQEIYFPGKTKLEYGFGFFVHDYCDMIIYHAPGHIDGICAVLAYCPEQDMGIAVLSNIESAAFVHKILFSLLDYQSDNK